MPENGSYLGLPLLIGVIAVALACWRNAWIRYSATMAVIAFVLTLGTRLTVDNHALNVPLPFALLTHLPLLQSSAALRYFLFVDLFVALLFAIGLDLLASGSHATVEGTSPAVASMPRRRQAVVALLGAAVLVPLVPRVPYPSPPTGVPAIFTSAQMGRIPPASVVLTYPYPSDPDNVAMLWAAQAGMAFKLLGDSAITPLPNGAGTTAPPVLSPSTMQVVLARAMYGTASPYRGLPRFDAATFQHLRDFITRYGVSAVLLQPRGLDPGLAVRYLTGALGPPTKVGGVVAWLDALGRARHLGQPR